MNEATPAEECSHDGERGVTWRLQAFTALDGPALYAILAERVAVFVVEQACPYQELDGLDDRAWHLAAWNESGRPVAYARILPPGTRFDEPSIGRVLTADAVRGTGMGRALMRRAMGEIQRRYPDSDIRISAQCYLERFYRSLGFRVETEPYDEDGIPHVDMRWHNGSG